MAESRGSTATPEHGQSAQKKSLIARILLFYRQVVAEMRKVVWPTRNELITYTIVVVVFVASFAAIVLVFDIGVAKVVRAIFG
ncbi:MAG: preprotein translocase subunit SecE [Actinomycetia bacterium]|nr:preprotein translocase subunit SecE [Actinomycetes bacterium]